MNRPGWSREQMALAAAVGGLIAVCVALAVWLGFDLGEDGPTLRVEPRAVEPGDLVEVEVVSPDARVNHGLDADLERAVDGEWQAVAIMVGGHLDLPPRSYLLDGTGGAGVPLPGFPSGTTHTMLIPELPPGRYRIAKPISWGGNRGRLHAEITVDSDVPESALATAAPKETAKMITPNTGALKLIEHLAAEFPDSSRTPGAEDVRCASSASHLNCVVTSDTDVPREWKLVPAARGAFSGTAFIPTDTIRGFGPLEPDRTVPADEDFDETATSGGEKRGRLLERAAKRQGAIATGLDFDHEAIVVLMPPGTDLAPPPEPPWFRVRHAPFTQERYDEALSDVRQSARNGWGWSVDAATGRILVSVPNEGELTELRRKYPGLIGRDGEVAIAIR